MNIFCMLFFITLNIFAQKSSTKTSTEHEIKETKFFLENMLETFGSDIYTNIDIRENLNSLLLKIKSANLPEYLEDLAENIADDLHVPKFDILTDLILKYTELPANETLRDLDEILKDVIKIESSVKVESLTLEIFDPKDCLESLYKNIENLKKLSKYETQLIQKHNRRVDDLKDGKFFDSVEKEVKALKDTITEQIDKVLRHIKDNKIEFNPDEFAEDEDNVDYLEKIKDMPEARSYDEINKVINTVKKSVKENTITSGGDTHRSQAETPRGTGNDTGSKPEEDY